MLKKIVSRLARNMGYRLTPMEAAETDITKQYPDFFEPEFWEIYRLCKPYTMTSVERMYSLFRSVSYVLEARIPGDFVEAGVWRGGSSMVIASMLRKRGITDRKIFLYDTFEGMSEPTEADVDFAGARADVLLKENESNKEESVWCLADLADVQQNMRRTALPESQVVYVKGKVEDTIPGTIPAGAIALLRLDTDWYESTRHELEHLYPRLSANGVLIIDDYGHWGGCRKAVDEYFAGKAPLLLHRVDYTGRAGIKTEAAAF
ncbi:TylF/MycF/NovP-related O-methyltransferase [Flaviaesturariibacter amylovorans]|uniref:Macrocin O-methyltransferase n=1 Tax=Flaviaesturariibacter amylovorans TaxID=1084520 RepID=A0ABP8HE52_9BACT